MPDSESRRKEIEDGKRFLFECAYDLSLAWARYIRRSDEFGEGSREEEMANYDLQRHLGDLRTAVWILKSQGVYHEVWKRKKKETPPHA